MTFTPSDLQAKAIKAAVQWYRDPHGPQVFYLAGYAGSGKTTVYETLRKELKVKNPVTCAFTGKAANVLRKKGTKDAMTIHSAIYSPVESEKDGNEVTFVKNPDGPAATADLIGLDECSMVNDEMAADLKSFGRKILVMGDPGQLPPIKGTGAFTAGEPDFFLDEIHRQAAESPIIRLATMARKGERIALGDYGDDVRVTLLDRETQHAVYDPRTQALCGVHKTRFTITRRYRERLGFAGNLALPGERIICCRNDKKRGTFNGSLGMVLDSTLDEETGHLTMDFQMEDLVKPIHDVPVLTHLFQAHYMDIEKPPFIRGVQEYDWAYALTVHKAQGSEWPHVTVVDDSGTFREDRHRHLYTALTRASEGLTLLKRTP